jgi:hypothetical protein
MCVSLLCIRLAHLKCQRLWPCMWECLWQRNAFEITFQGILYSEAY